MLRRVLSNSSAACTRRCAVSTPQAVLPRRAAAAFSARARPAGAEDREEAIAAAADAASSAPSAPRAPKKVKAAAATLKGSSMSDEEVMSAVEQGKFRFFNLENDLEDYERAVKIRRAIVEQKTGRRMEKLPYQHYDYSKVHGQCCENVIGHVGIPVGVAGPLLVDGKEYFLPMATTEGALVASTTRGCKALSISGGVTTQVVGDGMSRAPVLTVPNVTVANDVRRFIDENFDLLAQSFNSTSRFGRLKEVKCFIAGRKLYVRFKCFTGDAMGMNMVGKGVDHALSVITERFEGVEVLSLSGNVCTDKKPSAINWIEGRGKSIAADAVIRGDVVENVLKSSVAALVELNYAKNLMGSAIAGSIGGLNAHASNIVTAMFLATGQDPAQNVESSTCLTIMEPTNGGKDLYMSVSMPSLEVGTVGGGTSLAGQAAMLELLGVRGAHATTPGANSAQLARVIASAVMAGELSLMSALSSGHLISSHLKLNRAKHPAPAAVPAASPAAPSPLTDLTATLVAAGVITPTPANPVASPAPAL